MPRRGKAAVWPMSAMVPVLLLLVLLLPFGPSRVAADTHKALSSDVAAARGAPDALDSEAAAGVPRTWDSSVAAGTTGSEAWDSSRTAGTSESWDGEGVTQDAAADEGSSAAPIKVELQQASNFFGSGHPLQPKTKDTPAAAGDQSEEAEAPPSPSFTRNFFDGVKVNQPKQEEQQAPPPPPPSPQPQAPKAKGISKRPPPQIKATRPPLDEEEELPPQPKPQLPKTPLSKPQVPSRDRFQRQHDSSYIKHNNNRYGNRQHPTKVGTDKKQPQRSSTHPGNQPGGTWEQQQQPPGGEESYLERQQKLRQGEEELQQLLRDSEKQERFWEQERRQGRQYPVLADPKEEREHLQRLREHEHLAEMLMGQQQQLEQRMVDQQLMEMWLKEQQQQLEARKHSQQEQQLQQEQQEEYEQRVKDQQALLEQRVQEQLKLQDSLKEQQQLLLEQQQRLQELQKQEQEQHEQRLREQKEQEQRLKQQQEQQKQEEQRLKDQQEQLKRLQQQQREAAREVNDWQHGKGERARRLELRKAQYKHRSSNKNNPETGGSSSSSTESQDEQEVDYVDDFEGGDKEGGDQEPMDRAGGGSEGYPVDAYDRQDDGDTEQQESEEEETQEQYSRADVPVRPHDPYSPPKGGRQQPEDSWEEGEHQQDEELKERPGGHSKAHSPGSKKQQHREQEEEEEEEEEEDADREKQQQEEQQQQFREQQQQLREQKQQLRDQQQQIKEQQEQQQRLREQQQRLQREQQLREQKQRQEQQPAPQLPRQQQQQRELPWDEEEVVDIDERWVGAHLPSSNRVNWKEEQRLWDQQQARDNGGLPRRKPNKQSWQQQHDQQQQLQKEKEQQKRQHKEEQQREQQRQKELEQQRQQQLKQQQRALQKELQRQKQLQWEEEQRHQQEQRRREQEILQEQQQRELDKQLQQQRKELDHQQRQKIYKRQGLSINAPTDSDQETAVPAPAPAPTPSIKQISSDAKSPAAKRDQLQEKLKAKDSPFADFTAPRVRQGAGGAPAADNFFHDNVLSKKKQGPIGQQKPQAPAVKGTKPDAGKKHGLQQQPPHKYDMLDKVMHKKLPAASATPAPSSPPDAAPLPPSFEDFKVRQPPSGDLFSRLNGPKSPPSPKLSPPVTGEDEEEEGALAVPLPRIKSPSPDKLIEENSVTATPPAARPPEQQQQRQKSTEGTPDPPASDPIIAEPVSGGINSRQASTPSPNAPQRPTVKQVVTLPPTPPSGQQQNTNKALKRLARNTAGIMDVPEFEYEDEESPEGLVHVQQELQELSASGESEIEAAVPACSDAEQILHCGQLPVDTNTEQDTYRTCCRMFMPRKVPAGLLPPPAAAVDVERVDLESDGSLSKPLNWCFEKSEGACAIKKFAKIPTFPKLQVRCSARA